MLTTEREIESPKATTIWSLNHWEKQTVRKTQKPRMSLFKCWLVDLIVALEEESTYEYRYPCMNKCMTVYRHNVQGDET